MPLIRARPLHDRYERHRPPVADFRSQRRLWRAEFGNALAGSGNSGVNAVDARVGQIHGSALIVHEVFTRRSILLWDLVPGPVTVGIRHGESGFRLFRRTKIRHVGPQIRREIALDFLNYTAGVVNEVFARFETGDGVRADFILEQTEIAAARRPRSFRELRERRD